MQILEGEKVAKYFGGLAAIQNVDFNMNQGEVVGLIEPNGAGKTTLFNLISGLLSPASGSVEFLGRRIDNLPAYRIAELGISHIPEGGAVG